MQERIRTASDKYDYEYIEVSASIWQGVKYLQDNRALHLNTHLEYLNGVCAELREMRRDIEYAIGEMREDFQELLEAEEEKL